MLTIRYNQVIGLVMMVLGIGNIALGGWLTLLGSFSVSLVLGFIVALLGALYLTRPYFFVTPSAVIVPAMIGPVRRTFDFGGKAEHIKIENGKLMVHNGSQWKRVPVQRWFCNASDWGQLEAQLSGQR